MATKTVTKLFTLLVIVATAWTSGCTDQSRNGAPAPVGRQDPYSAPLLNKTETATPFRRDRTPDNFVESCLFLNDSFKATNTASVCVQTDLSLTGKQVTDQSADFHRLGSDSTLSTFSVENTVTLGDRVKPEDIRSGDLFYFKKSNRSATYEMTIEIVSIDSDSVTLSYQVKSFNLL